MHSVNKLQKTSVRGAHIENLNIGTTVDGSTNVDRLLLTTGQGDATSANLREIAVGKELQVRIQARVGDGLPVPLGFERFTEAHVITDGGVLRFDQ